MDHHHLQQQRSEPEAACSRVNHQAADLGLGGRCGPTRCGLNDAGAENVLSAAVHDVKQPVLPCRVTEYMRRTVEQCSLVQRFDEGEGKSIFGLASQPDLDSVLILDHCRSLHHRPPPRSVAVSSRELPLTLTEI